MPTEYHGRLYSNDEVSDVLDPDRAFLMDRGAVTRALANAGIRVVHGWPADLIDRLSEYRELSKYDRRGYPFGQWLKDRGYDENGLRPEEIPAEEQSNA